MPAISIVMPLRDGEPWLAQAIDSITGQSERDWELVVIDDGSRDGGLRLLEAQAAGDPRIRLARTEPSERGIVSALNLGLRLARGRFLARMDADDLCEPVRLAEQRVLLESDAELLAAGCMVRAFPESALRDGMRRYLDWQNALVEPAEIARDRFVESTVLHPTLMLRTAELRRLGGWQAAEWPEDWDLLLRVLESGAQVAKVAQPLYRWRLHARQASRTDPRYSEDAFHRARSHYLGRELKRSLGGRELWILGAGPLGKRLGKSLADQGLPLAGFADIDPKKIGGSVAREARGGVAWPVVSMDDMLARDRRALAVAAVGQAGARERIRGWLIDAGWRETEDFWVAA